MKRLTKLVESLKTVASALHVVHWVVIFLSLGLTLFAWFYSKEQVAAKIQQQFDRQANQIVHLVIERMEKYEDALWAGVAKIHADQNKVSFADWQSYVNSLNILKKYPGINGMGVIYSVRPGALSDFLQQHRYERPEFNIHPSHQNRRYLPITYIVPVKGNEKAVGLDMAFEANRFAAAIRAERSGEAQLTGPIVLVQDKEKTPGFLLFAPFYAKQNLATIKARESEFLGMVYAPFIMKKLMSGTLDKKNRDISIKISDQHSVLFDELGKPGAQGALDAKYQKRVSVGLYGRTWTFDLWGSRAFVVATSNSQPYVILLGGIVIDCLLILLFVQMSGARRRAIKYAKSLNREIHSQAQKHATLNKRLELALSASQVGVWEYDIHAREFIWDEAMLRLYGFDGIEFSGAHDIWVRALHSEDRLRVVAALDAAIADVNKFDATFRIVLPNNHIRMIRALADVVFEEGQPKRMVGVNWDITDEKDKEAQLERLAKYDVLSQLKNRFSFNESCAMLIKRAQQQGHQFALLLIDLDDFKQVNDLYGHQVGDQLISLVSDRLKDVCRARDLVFRLGGDEFAVLSDFIDDDAGIVDLSERILNTFRGSFNIEGNTVQCSCSIGIAVFPYAGSDPDALATSADTALYKSKAEGKDCANFFTESLNERAKRLRFIKAGLMKAVNNGELFMNYQPIVDAKENKTVAIEALARWHSSVGLIPPDEFVAVAEKNNTIDSLGRAIVHTVARDMCREPMGLKVSINCSSKQLVESAGFNDYLLSTLQHAGVAPDRVILEVTESYLIRDYEEISKTLNEIHAEGVDIAIDDFGTGYSSLSLLANIPFQYLKIDREFVTNIHSSTGFKVLQCIYNVANSLNKKVIAEGVETREQLDKLLGMGIYLIQGYYFSRPVEIDEVILGFKH